MLGPACSYLAYFKAYQPLLNLNVETYVGALALKGTELSLAEITQEVSTQTAQLATMEEQLQGSVNLGLIQVNCTKVGKHMCTSSTQTQQQGAATCERLLEAVKRLQFRCTCTLWPRPTSCHALRVPGMRVVCTCVFRCVSCCSARRRGWWSS